MGAPFGFTGYLGGGAVPDVQMPDGLPVAGGKGSPLVDAFLALQGQRIKDAVTAPRDAISGDLQVMGPDGHPTSEAMDRANGMAGLAMTGSMPFKAPAGAIRSFGGAAAHADDPFAALEAALAQHLPEAPKAGAELKIAPSTSDAPTLLDPAAKQWDVFHGSTAGPNFDRFDPNMASNPAERGAVFFAPRAETANSYAESLKSVGEAGDRVYRTTVEPGRTGVLDIAKLAETDPAFNAQARDIYTKSGGHPQSFDAHLEGFMARRAGDRDVAAQMKDLGYLPNPADESRMNFGFGHIGAAIERAKAQGLDTAIIRGLAEHGGDDQLIALTPGRVRSYYDPDHVLYSGGPGGGVGLSAQASSSDPKGPSVTAGSPFGSLALPLPPGVSLEEVMGSLSPQQRAALGGSQVAPAQPPAVPPSLLGAQPPQMPEPAQGAPALPSLVRQPMPAMPQGAGAAPAMPRPPAAPSEEEADKPAPNAVPAQARAPLSLAPPAAPAAPASPQVPATAPATPGGPSFGDRFSDGLKKNGDLLIGLGTGLMSTRGVGNGLAAGLQYAQKSEKDRAVTDLAKAEFGLKSQKAAQEQRQLTGNAQYVMGKVPGISADQALTLGSNSTFMNELFKGVLPPSELFKQFSDKDGNIWNQNARTGQATVALKADEDKTQRPLTDPAERARYGIAADDQKPYQVDANNKVSAIGGGGTSVSVDLGKKAAGEADAQILKKIDTSYDKAQGAIGTLGAISRQKQALDQGIIAGWGSNLRTNAQAMAEQLLGISPDEKLSPTYSFDAASKQKGAELAKAISQAGHTTNMDLNLGNTIAGGDRDKTEKALRSIIDAQEMLAKDAIAHHNAGVDRYVGTSPEMKDRMGWYHVETPDVYRYGQGTPNPVADPGSTPAPATRTLNGKTYSRGPDGHWYEGR